MNNFYKKLFIVFLFLAFCINVRATHIVGGELYYRYLGNNRYQITLIVYRDCYNGVPPFDNPASIGVFNVNNSLVHNLFVFNPVIDTIPPAINSPCFIPPTDVCYERGIYVTTDSLPPVTGGYQLVYQRCCRNFSILNIVDPLATGITVYANIPGDPAQAINSNPVYNNLPPSFLCLGVPFVWDNSATDIDGDSIAYELCVPFHGAEQNPCGGNPQPCGPQPSPPFSPPYANVTWQSPFGLANLLGGIPLTIDAFTGVLTATPNTIGQFVIGICAKEYRNGILLSTTRRDYQFNVVACPSLIVSAFQEPLIYCGNFNVSFLNQSIGASSYDWNFGDLTTSGDTSHSTNPSYTYPDTGIYIVTLIAHSSFNPSCADTTIDTVKIFPPFEADFSYDDSLCTYIINFSDTVVVDDGGITNTWSWIFGDGGTSNTSDPSHQYNAPGNYAVTLYATSDRGCRDTITKNIVVDDLPTATTSLLEPISCNGDCDASVLATPSGGTPPYTFQWNDPDTTSTPSADNLCPGNYIVTVTDSNGCATMQNINVTEPPVLTSSTSSTDAYCKGRCIGTASVISSGGTFPVSYVWNDPDNQGEATATGLCPGIYTVLVTDAHGCTRIDSTEVFYSDYIPPLDASVSDDTVFVGQTVQLTSTIYTDMMYLWTPASVLSDPGISNPTATFNSESTYLFEVMIIDTNVCDNKDSVRVVVLNVTCEEPELFIPNAFTPNSDGANDKLYVRGNTIRELLFRVYDRWGEKVFETNIPSVGWDATFKGKPVQPGVYDYYFEAICFDNEKFFKKGNVTVIR